MGRRWPAIALILGVLAAACESQPPRTASRPVAGGELVVAVRDLGTFDPASAGGRGALLAVAQVFDSLTAIDPETNEVVPAAAESWNVTRNGLRWTFVLREAVYHDGSRVRARDFKFAFDRLARKSTGSDAAFQLEAVRGFRDSHTLGTAPSLDGVEVRDDRTLVIFLERPYAELPYALAHPALAPVSVRLYGEDQRALARQPIGNGPFKATEVTLEEEAVLARNDAYTPTPYLDRLRLVVASDTDDGWGMFLHDDVHLADVPTASVSAARVRYGANGFTPQWSMLAFGPNLRRPKYAKVEVRRAISLAIDREAIANTVYGGTKDPATGILPRGIRGYVPDACSACVRDVQRARQILQAAFPDGIPALRIDHLNDQASRQVFRAIGVQLEEVGFSVALRAHSPTQYLRLLQNAGHDLAQLGWISDVPSPDGFLAQQLRTGSPNNQTGFADSRFDRLVDDARGALDAEGRLDAYRAAEDRALELMPLIPVVFFRNRAGVAERVHGLTLDGAGLFDASVVWIEQ